MAMKTFHLRISWKIKKPKVVHQHYVPVLWNRNRNRRNCNFLPCGTGTVINYGSGTGTR
jgi:hypothetical protein